MSAFDPIRAVLTDPVLQAQLDDLELTYNALAARYTQLDADLSVLRDQRRELKARLDAMPTRVALERRVQDLEQDLTAATDAYVRCSSKRNVLETRLATLAASHHNLTDLLRDIARALDLPDDFLNFDILDAIQDLKAKIAPTP